jgi:hypothetical protein
MANPFNLMKSKLLLLAACSGLCSLLPAAEPNTLTPAESAAGWHLLFDGKSLDGWKANESPEVFTVSDGQLIVKGPRCHLFYTGAVANHDFKNFELSVDVLTKPSANSGVYFHTEFQATGWPFKGYEVQVNNTQKDPSRTAGLYGIKGNLDTVAKDDEWFTLTIRVEGRHIVTSVDGKVVVDFTEPEAWTPPKNFEGRKIAHGTFAIQGHDPASEIHYRNIKVRQLP